MRVSARRIPARHISDRLPRRELSRCGDTRSAGRLHRFNVHQRLHPQQLPGQLLHLLRHESAVSSDDQDNVLQSNEMWWRR